MSYTPHKTPTVTFDDVELVNDAPAIKAVAKKLTELLETIATTKWSSMRAQSWASDLLSEIDASLHNSCTHSIVRDAGEHAETQSLIQSGEVRYAE